MQTLLNATNMRQRPFDVAILAGEESISAVREHKTHNFMLMV